MTRVLTMLIALLTATAAASAIAVPTCTTVAGDRITAGDLARAVPGFSSLAPDTPVGYAPVPGARRIYRAAEVDRLAVRYKVPVASSNEICFERVMEQLQPDRVVNAMRHALNNLEARIEVLELSRYPVPPGEIQFSRSTLPPAADAPVIWRGFVRYGGERRFAIWARVRILVRAQKIVAVENLTAGSRIEARQVRLEECDVFPSQVGKEEMDGIVGKIARRPISAGSPITATLLEEPKDVERGQMVEVEVRSGAARLKLEGRAQSAGRTGDAIRVRNLSTGKSFSAHVSAKGQVVLSATTAAGAKESKP
ncbi:MAG: flagellar basal body P-ring formation protein FlgA [Candidatus Solibacter usitatus]|nr:flagellar basal body P-ring formation protein FlgA [Candidatus Solibacter usitatus]